MAEWTFRSLIEEGMNLHAYCYAYGCDHHAELPITLLADHYGLDAPAMNKDLVPKLVCTKCGSKNCGLRYTPDPARHKGMWDGR
ncbi:hypothetical protein ACVCNR_00955 [Aquamicrobium terrae]